MALALPGSTPFGQAAASALRKLVAAMRVDDAEAARAMLRRVQLIDRDGGVDVPAILERAMLERRVVAIDYVDRDDVLTTGRLVEPHSFTGDGRWWYLVGWCRLRDDGRSFRVDRIRSARLTDEPAPERDLPPPPEIASRLRRPTLE